MRQLTALLLFGCLACAEDLTDPESGNPHLLPGELGRISATTGPPGPEGVGVRLAYQGTLSPTGTGLAHLPPEAGNLNFKPMMRCYVRQDEGRAYIEIMPVEDDPVPCGFSAHNTHLDAIVESTTRPSWQANIALLVP